LEENNRIPLPDGIEIKENVYKSNMQETKRNFAMSTESVQIMHRKKKKYKVLLRQSGKKSKRRLRVVQIESRLRHGPALPPWRGPLG
jgi:hypothetical protein